MKSMKLLSVVRRIWARGRLAGRRFFNVLVVTVRGIPLESRSKKTFARQDRPTNINEPKNNFRRVPCSST